MTHNTLAGNWRSKLSSTICERRSQAKPMDYREIGLVSRGALVGIKFKQAAAVAKLYKPWRDKWFMIPNNAFSLTQDPGKLKLQGDGIHFKSSKTNKILHIKETEIESGEWLRAARGYEMKVLMQDGVAKFDGFKESVIPRVKVPMSVCVCMCVCVCVVVYVRMCVCVCMCVVVWLCM